MAERHRTCEICGIREKTLSEKRFFARFPLDKNRCADWLKVVGKEDLAYLPVHKLHDLKYICEIHFTKQDLTKSRTRLKKNSVPKLHLTLAQLSDDIIAEFLRLNSHLSEQSVHAGAASTAVEQQPAATSQSTSDLEISSVNLKSASTASAVSTAVEEDPTASTSQSASVLGISPVNVQSLTQQAVPALPASDEPVASTSGGTKRKLDDNIVNVQSVRQQAVPALPASDEPVASTSGGTKRKLDDNIYATPRKRKLLMQLRKTKCTLASLKKSATLVENLSSTVLKDFVLSALQNQKRKPQGKRWTLKNKISALAILKRSPKAYRYMQHMMPLPSIKTLQNILKKMPMEPGINPAVISHLKKIANNFKHKDKLCTLAFDEMALKERLTYNMATDKVEGFVDTGIERKGELANHALVFMLQGVGKKIKQPLAFYFVKGTISTEKLAVLVKDTIKEINSTGFNIIATICDQGPTNLGALRLLKEWHKGEDNYFEMDNKKVFFIFDVPHLFKSIRNNFLKQGGIKMEERIGKWSHIMEVEEQNRGFLYLSKITPTHVQPKYRAKMRVKYAVQILSQTVAVVLKLLAKCVENQHRSDEILQTALIVEDLNKLFDYTNGPSSPNDIKKGIRENVSAKSNHVRVWSEFRHKLSTLKFVGENGADAKNVRCIEGYIITLKSLADIWNLVKNTGYKHLNLRQLNQDALENLFGIIRQHSPTNNHPTCSTFIAALKTTVISGMTAPHSRGFNCEKDDKLLLTNFHEVIFDKTEETTHEDNEEISIEVVNDPPVLSLPDNLEDMELEADLTQIKEQPLVYISGYIAARIMKKSQCIDCKNSLTVNDPMDNPLYELIKLKEWWQDKQSLTYPSLNLCRVVEKAIKTFETEGIPNFHYIDICQWIVTLIHTNCNTEWLQCNAHAEKITHEVYSKLALLLVRRQCQRVNLSKASKEEDLADANKKGQQYGVAK